MEMIAEHGRAWISTTKLLQLFLVAAAWMSVAASSHGQASSGSVGAAYAHSHVHRARSAAEEHWADTNTAIAFGISPEHEEAALAAWLPAWWSLNGASWQASPSEPESLHEPYHGQDEEDRHLLERYFYGHKHGTYLEMGALDGVLYSNTLHLQRAHGWRGMLIEAAPDMYGKMVTARPHDIGLNAAICDHHRWVHFSPGGDGGAGGIGGPAIAGIYEFMNDAFREQWHSHVDLATLQVVPCLPLSLILKKFQVSEIDFWSLDVEGAELQVLQTFDFDAVRINVVCIEADGHDSERDAEVIALMQSKGYIYQESLLRNAWFTHHTFTPMRAPPQASIDTQQHPRSFARE